MSRAGLFRKVFSQSGTALCPWTIAEDVPAKSAAIGHHLGCPTRPSAELVKCLTGRPAKQILEAVKIFFVSADGQPVIQYLYYSTPETFIKLRAAVHVQPVLAFRAGGRIARRKGVHQRTTVSDFRQRYGRRRPVADQSYHARGTLPGIR